jgi:hypothetical protein
VSTATPAAQLAGFIAKFDASMARRIRSVRSALRKRFPTANELVYDNYNFFVIGYSPTERPSDTIVSLAADAHGVGISFYHGATLADPHGLLHGSGVQNRFLRDVDAATLLQPEVVALLRAAAAQAKPLPRTGGGKLVIRSVSAKQRPRQVARKV